MDNPASSNAPGQAVQPLTYHGGDAEPWPIDVRIIVILAMLAGAAGVLSVAAEACLNLRPGAFVTVGSGLRSASRSSYISGLIYEGLRLSGSALLLSGAIGFLARKRVARKLLLAGAVLTLIVTAISIVMYWGFQIFSVATSPTETAGDRIVKGIWNVDELIKQVAIPLAVIVILWRPSVRSRFRAAGA